jgi:large subunit ribosomal protein L17
MRHRVQTKQLGRNTKQRQALFKSLVRDLLTHGSITTTQAKAKTIRPIAEKIITKAKVDSIATRRHLHLFFGKRDAVNTLVDRIAPAFAGRSSGYTRIVFVGNRRGDNAEMVKLELVDQPEILSTLRKPAKDTGKTVVVKENKSKNKVEKPAAKEEKPGVVANPSVLAVATKETKATKTNFSAKKSGQTTRSITASKKK